ncbi:MAG: tyrosine--tRNA ligase [Pseudanabaena sp. M135S2SP2A07QC]|uniref:tyrosine--tRNA ligase n=1 Tax=Microcystis sp. M087S2 TaxID=2771176 RepID=UPI002584B2D8|nr:tyrosine--tRNA ligase [Microcystis sp. M087S2]MCA6502709.1 tyrosine--tRNA ligase [Pseudanabaena sp. M090S1SP2A07QC]MCA6506364.1 tyrosine--tRNA ligase [Pseudanabaena sp. M172S2SP2A07QC]MCA6520178.1 tyrosine--tRNA ligase [Pseudanabaena sp. M110S1SP2A07QC]MCA6521391.1 tyrosine--tRNA ligase [Pseudanabaena sp. M051S1SP2A07QC]MCA6524815.1 tyrosine--tRNA ligase [Pseudanabaena sp. M179S2SP2A07QC]MCA6531304.1 tyrosine--tRNA ligase [Pseudanabaena sp. M125S2SP2A07QC]MCA6536427.1 tyrosine--tRNA ligas
MSSSTDQTNLSTLLERGVVEIFPDSESDNLGARIQKSDRPLRIKLGIDPTRPDLHLGHTVALRKLRQFQDAGHKAVLIIGDFTAQIGDPTGRSEARPRLTPEEVTYNADTYLEQAKKILDFSGDRFELRRNGEWLNKLDLQQIINLQASMTVGQMLAKVGFSDRYEKGNPIYLHEFLYPLLQGYDSIAIDSDVELGGTDQKFNILVGRDLQLKDKNRQGKPAQFGLLLPLLVGLDGVQKMSKSLGNYVGITDEPLSMYSKLEKVPDALVDKYFELLTDIDLATLPDNPREKQKQLALAIVGQYHSPEVALQAQRDAEQIVLAGNTTDLGDIPEFDLAQINFPVPLHYLVKVSGLCKSNSEAQSQIKNGAVKLDGEKLGDRTFASVDELSGKVLQVGKKKFLRLA